MSMTRRRFLGGLGGVAAGLLTARGEGRAASVYGSQLYGWGQYYGRMGKDLWANLDEVFSALRDSGYDYAEGNVDTATPENNARFAERLKRKGLRPVSLYTGGRLHERGPAEDNAEKLLKAAKSCKEAGFAVINCNPDPIGRAKTAEELGTQAKVLGMLGKELAAMGLGFGIHHHTPELADGAREFRSNFDRNTAEVGFCYDVHWVFRGGIQPAQALKEYGSRIVSWHLRQSREGIWWEDLDTGDIDYAAVARHAKEHGLARRFTVELAIENGAKITRSGVENHRRSLDYVKRVFEA